MQKAQKISPEQAAVIDAIVSASVEALFEAYDLTLSQCQEPSSEENGPYDTDSASTIGFSSKEMSGSLVVAVPRLVAKHTMPAAGAVPIHDWMGEMANQLLGRIKNQFLRYDVVLGMSIPVVVSGRELKTPNMKAHEVRYFVFDSDIGKVVVRFDVVLAPGFVFTEQAGASSGAEEGDLMLF